MTTSTKPVRTAKGTPQSAAKSTARMEAAFGVALLVLGTFIVLAVSNPLEFAVYAGGPIMAIIGLTVAILAGVRRAGTAPVVFGIVAFFLGSLLAVHDFLFSPGIATFIHAGIGISTLVLGLVQLLAKKRFYGRWFRRGSIAGRT